MSLTVNTLILIGAAALLSMIGIFAWDLLRTRDPATAAERSASRWVGFVAGTVSVIGVFGGTLLLTAASSIPEVVALLIGLVGLGGIQLGIRIEIVAATMLIVYIIGASISDPSVGGR